MESLRAELESLLCHLVGSHPIIYYNSLILAPHHKMGTRKPILSHSYEGR